MKWWHWALIGGGALAAVLVVAALVSLAPVARKSDLPDLGDPIAPYQRGGLLTGIL